MLLLFKTLHIIFAISWFAGLFYMVRLLIYHEEAQQQQDIIKRQILTAEYARIMRLLWCIILPPALTGTLLFGALMLYINPAYLSQSWLQVKLMLVLLLLAYHFSIAHLMKQKNSANKTGSTISLRLYNELATILLAGIVSLAVFKTSIDFSLLFLILIVLSLLFTFIIVRVNSRK